MVNSSGRSEKEKRFYEKMEQKLQSFPPILKEYYLYLINEKKSYTTIGVYINNIIHFANFLGHGRVLDDFYKYVKTIDVENYLIFSEIKVADDGLDTKSDSILQMRWSVLKNFFEWLLSQKYIVQNPVLSVKRAKAKKQGRAINLLTQDELQSICDEIYRYWNVDALKSRRDMAVFCLAANVGMKPSEISNLNIQDIDIENNEINVRDGQQPRKLEICDFATWALEEWVRIRKRVYGNVDSDALFISQLRRRMSVDAMNDALLGYSRDAGIKRKITINDFRSTAICQLLKNNVHVDRIAEYFGFAETKELICFMQALEDEQVSITEVLNDLFD
ncbi:MAG: tyrosine-type recombinase/integrase [Clostridia bacterium]|nr:tyrosine-type recombinase/integrase [Clostridia bacterium]